MATLQMHAPCNSDVARASQPQIQLISMSRYICDLTPLFGGFNNSPINYSVPFCTLIFLTASVESSTYPLPSMFWLSLLLAVVAFCATTTLRGRQKQTLPLPPGPRRKFI